MSHEKRCDRSGANIASMIRGAPIRVAVLLCLQSPVTGAQPGPEPVAPQPSGDPTPAPSPRQDGETPDLGAAATTPCTRDRGPDLYREPSRAAQSAFAEWSARRRRSGSLSRWAKYIAMAGSGAFAGAVIGTEIRHGSVTIDSSSPWLFLIVGTPVLAASFDIASLVVAPGPYRPPAAVVGTPMTGTHIVSGAWRF